MTIGLMSSLNQKYNNWQNGTNHNLPNPTNTNSQQFAYTNPSSPGINGWCPQKSLSSYQAIGMNGNIVKIPNLNNYAAC